MTREESIKIYKTYSRKLFNISFRIVGNSALAEEIMQDTLLKFLSTADALASGSPLATGRTQPQRSEDGLGRGQGRRESAWLTKTCVRASIDALRKMRREREFLDEYAGDGIDDCGEENGGGEFVDVDGGSLTVERVKTAMGTLPKQYRLILTLVLIEGLDYEEISEMTGEREGALRTRFSRTRKMLAERLRKG